MAETVGVAVPEVQAVPAVPEARGDEMHPQAILGRMDRTGHQVIKAVPAVVEALGMAAMVATRWEEMSTRQAG